MWTPKEDAATEQQTCLQLLSTGVLFSLVNVATPPNHHLTFLYIYVLVGGRESTRVEVRAQLVH